MRIGDGTRRAVLLLLAAAGLALAAWLASNLIDGAPHTRPPELAVAPPAQPPQRNLAFTLSGLRAPADQSPAAAGLAAWQQQLSADERKRTRRAVLLALQAAQQPAAGREVWWRERGAADPARRDRVSWRNAGSTLVVSTFAEALGPTDPRHRIELRLPQAAAAEAARKTGP